MSDSFSNSQLSLKSMFSKLRYSPKLTNSNRGSSSSLPPDKSLVSHSPSPVVSRTNSFTSINISLNKYGKKIEVLGSGISSKVDLYYKKQDKQYYAVKVFRGKETYETKEEYKNRCYLEYEITKDLNHINIAKTITFMSGGLSGTNELVIEFAPYPLLKVIRSSRPNEDEIICFFKQICEGLEYLHQKGIAHRDLKLENIQLDKNGVIKLIDFGAAFHYGINERKLARGVVGTEALVSPEALSRLEYDGDSSDVWSLGIVLYSMLNLNFPWKAAKESDKEFKAFKEDQTIIKDKYPDKLWDPIIMKILKIEPLERIKIPKVLEELRKIDSVCAHDECPPKRHSRTLRICQQRFRYNI